MNVDMGHNELPRKTYMAVFLGFFSDKCYKIHTSSWLFYILFFSRFGYVFLIYALILKIEQYYTKQHFSSGTFTPNLLGEVEINVTSSQ